MFSKIRSLLRSALLIHFLVLFSGMAALSWEVIWQIKSTLALGVSAWGAAITLAVTMGGMSFGALLMGHILQGKTVIRPFRLYGVLECIIGASGLLLGTAFGLIEMFDGRVYASAPEAANPMHLVAIVCALGAPAMAMGATLPVLGLTAKQFRCSLAVLYGLNTFGAALGVLLVAFLWIPLFGISKVILFISAINFVVGLSAFALGPGDPVSQPEKDVSSDKAKSVTASSITPRMAMIVVFVTGFATFMLEVSWFRSMTAAFYSTTSAFAVMLASVLTALALGAAFAPILKRSNVQLGPVICWSGIFILLVTPVVERFDLFMYNATEYPLILFTRWFFLTLYIIGTPVLLLGTPLPWILDDQTKARRWGQIYGLNAFAAILGATAAAWIFLPTIGFARTSWLTGAIVFLTGMMLLPKQRRAVIASIGCVALLCAVFFESGVGRTRIQGGALLQAGSKVLKSYEGPDATVSVVGYENGKRMLLIDGFVATLQTGDRIVEHYMPWMGHLPMLAHPDPKKALVICFGTGQTANAVRKEGPDSLDIVDVNANVYKLAGYFPANEGVLRDKRVNNIVMDGRAYIRRTDNKYDVITLEPMPPHFAGVNALYSKEFYENARRKMTSDGVIAQWLPFHLVSPYYAASIVRTFQSVFPNSVLWMDVSTTGILVGSVNEDLDLENGWPGLKRRNADLDLSDAEIRRAVILNPDDLKQYGLHGGVITDDNQLLAYGHAAYQAHGLKNLNTVANYDLIKTVAPFDWNEIWESTTANAAYALNPIPEDAAPQANQ